MAFVTKLKRIQLLKLRLLSKPKGRKQIFFFYLYSAEGTKQAPSKDKREERHMERKLHTHKYTPTHPSKRNCLASSGFRSMNTPPPPAKLRGPGRKRVRAKETEVLFSLKKIFNELTFNVCAQGRGSSQDACEGEGRQQQHSHVR